MELTWDRLTDTRRWAELSARVERVDDTGEICNERDLAEELTDPTMRPEHFVGVSIDDELVGYAAVRPREQPVGDRLRTDVSGAVDPAHRGQGIGSQLLAWSIRQAVADRDARYPDLHALVTTDGYPANRAQVGLLAELGFEVVGREVRMERPCSAPVPSPPDFDEIQVTAYDQSRSAEVLDAHNQAFGDYNDFTPWSPAKWRQWVDGTSAARPHLSRVAYDESSGAVVAYLISQEYVAVAETTGVRDLYVSKLGTIRTHRDRGIARGLLSRVVSDAAAAGYDTVSLDADTDSPTGAYGLYASVGFVVRRRHNRFALTVPPSVPRATVSR